MIPRGSEGIVHIKTRILSDQLPKASDAYTGVDLAMIADMVGMVAQDYDRAADVLISDDADMRAIFGEAAAVIDDAGLKARMAAVLASQPASLRIHELSARADVAMRVLIDLHGAAEAAEGAGADGAGDLNRLIWTFLDNHVARRTYETAF